MEASTDPRKLRIAIIGGGIGGLSCAVALRDCPNIELDLYEQAAQITEIGAGITVWPRTWEVLKSLGLDTDLQAFLKEQDTEEQKLAFNFRISDRKDGYTFHKLYARGGGFCYHRQEIQRTLMKHIPDFCRIKLSHRLTRCEEEDDRVKLFFDNGSEQACDLVIGGDGIKSVTRRALPNDGIFYTGTIVYRGLIPREKLAGIRADHRALEDPLIYCGKSKHIVVYPISGGRIINVVGFVSKPEDEGQTISGPEVRGTTTKEVLEAFAGWEDEAIELLGSMENPSRWVIQDQRPLQTYISGRIALIGDAAHAMTPHLGAGAGQAVEDGYVLGRLISASSSGCEFNTERVIGVLKAYDSVRQAFGNRIQRNARNQGFYYEMNAPEFDDVKAEGQELTTEHLSVLSSTITRNWSWWEEDADKDLGRALAVLHEHYHK